LSLDAVFKQLRFLNRGLLILTMVVFFFISAEAQTSALKNTRATDSLRKSNKNYSNACKLLARKRMAKAKPFRKSKRKMSKWR